MHVIITGGASGIGYAIAQVYAEKGADISLVARTETALLAKRAELQRGFPSQRFGHHVADVADAVAVTAAVDQAIAQLGECDVLVVSAGIVDAGRFDDLGAARFDAQIATNLTGAANTVRAVFPGMQRRRSGKIILLGSAAGFVGLYGYTAYCASKYGLLGFAEALRQEARIDGIDVSICMPPDVDTPQLKNEVRPAETEAAIGKGVVLSARSVANAIFVGADRGQFMIIPDLSTRLLGRFGQLFMPLVRWHMDRRIRRFRARQE